MLTRPWRRAEQRTGHVDDRRLPPIGQLERDAGALFHAAGLQCAAQTAGHGDHVVTGQVTPGLGQHDAVRVFGGQRQGNGAQPRLRRGDVASLGLQHGEAVGQKDGLLVRDMRRLMQMVFQDSYSSLNPRMPIEDSIAYGKTVHGASSGEAKDAARELMKKVGLDPNLFGPRYPHELSGGMRQRVVIAMAIALRPDVMIADEPTTALDVTIQAQILDLMQDLRSKVGSAGMLITHALGVVAEFVLWLGGQMRIVFRARIDNEVNGNGRHVAAKLLWQTTVPVFIVGRVRFR